MNIRTNVNPFFLVYKLADAEGSFPSRYPTSLLPANDGVIKMAPNTNFGQSADNKIHFVFFGQGSGGTFDAQIIFWNKVPGLNQQTQYFVQTTSGFDIWIPEVVYNVSGSLGSLTGVSGTYIDDTHYISDTLAATSDTENIADAQLLSPSGGVASLTLDMSGAQLIEVVFNNNSSTAMNAIYKTY